MTLRQDVEKFLNEFKYKMKIFGIWFIDRNKNRETLQELLISPDEQNTIIRSIEVEDFSEGPIKSALEEWGELWVFGKNVKEKEVYIKISMGGFNKSTICVSFHISEHPLNFPFKNINLYAKSLSTLCRGFA